MSRVDPKTLEETATETQYRKQLKKETSQNKEHERRQLLPKRKHQDSRHETPNTENPKQTHEKGAKTILQTRESW